MKKIVKMIVETAVATGLMCTSACSGGQSKKVEKVTVEASEKVIVPTKTVQFTAAVLPASLDQSVTWSSSDETILKINDKGVGLGVKEGKVIVTATSKVDTSAKGTLSFEVVSQSAVVTLDGFTEPSNITTYRNNVKDDNMEKVSEIPTITRYNSDSHITGRYFYNNDETKETTVYKVGTANAFIYQCSATGYDSEERRAKEDAYQDFVLEKEQDGKFVPVAETELSSYLDLSQLNDKNSSFKFKEGVTGKFKLTLSPSKAHYKFTTEHSYSLVFEVVSGYNVYDFAGLTTFDNWNEARNLAYNEKYKARKDLPADFKYGIWDEFKASHNIPNQSFERVILHNNISITSDDLPTRLLWSENEVNNYIKNYSQSWLSFVQLKMSIHQIKDQKEGEQFCKNLLLHSLRDRVSIFVRFVDEGETFDFEGNYFSIDASAVKPVVSFEDNTLADYQSADGSHSCLFGFPGDSEGWWQKENGVGEKIFDTYRPSSPYANLGTASIRNVKLRGNAPRSGDADEGAGGLIGFKFTGKELNLTNVIASEFFTPAVVAMSTDNAEGKKPVDVTFNLDRCRFTDAYSSMLYFWGDIHNNITNSFLKNAGGAIIINDEVLDVEGGDVVKKHPPISQIDNSYLEAFVTGQEQWFKSKGPAGLLAAQVAAVGAKKGDFYDTYANPAKPYVEGKTGKTFGKLDGEDAKANFVALSLCTGHIENTYKNGALTSAIKINNKNVIDFNEANRQGSIVNTYKQLANSGAISEGVPAPSFVLQSDAGGHTWPLSFYGVNDGLMFDKNIPAELKTMMMQLSTYLGEQRGTIDALDKEGVIRNNFSNLFQGDYVAMYTQGIWPEAHLFGLVLGYK